MGACGGQTLWTISDAGVSSPKSLGLSERWNVVEASGLGDRRGRPASVPRPTLNPGGQATPSVGRRSEDPVEYRSNLSVLGLPLIHVATGAIAGGIYRRRVAMGWIAVGDAALGIFFSCGGVALGSISVGGASLGVLSLGGLASGAAAVGGLAAGVLALGGAACVWYTAIGGLAVAHDYEAG